MLYVQCVESFEGSLRKTWAYEAQRGLVLVVPIEWLKRMLRRGDAMGSYEWDSEEKVV